MGNNIIGLQQLNPEALSQIRLSVYLFSDDGITYTGACPVTIPDWSTVLLTVNRDSVAGVQKTITINGVAHTIPSYDDLLTNCPNIFELQTGKAFSLTAEGNQLQFLRKMIDQSYTPVSSTFGTTVYTSKSELPVAVDIQVTGMHYVNGAMPFGKCDDTALWSPAGCTLSIDTTKAVSGGKCLKITSTTSGLVGAIKPFQQLELTFQNTI